MGDKLWDCWLRQGGDAAPPTLSPSQLSSLSSRGSPSSLPMSESQDEWALPLVLRSNTASFSAAPSTGSVALSSDLLMGKTRPVR